MPLLRQKWIYRSDLQSNPDVLYLFGDNDQRQGLGGQAKEMRGEPNAVGVRTKYEPNDREESFFRDEDVYYHQQVGMIDVDLRPVYDHLKRGGIVVLPTDGLGTGLSQLPERAPRTAEFLDELYDELANIGPSFNA